MLFQALSSSRVAGVVAWVPLDAPDDAAAQLDKWRREPIVGIGHRGHDGRDPDWLLRPRRRRRPDAPHRATPDPRPHRPDAHGSSRTSRPLAEQHPKLTVVLDHLGAPPLAALRAGDRRRLGALVGPARRRRAAAATSSPSCPGSTTAAGAGWTPADLRPAVDRALEVFGPDRLMLGSDWPYALLEGDSYAQVWHGLRTTVDALPDADRARGPRRHRHPRCTGCRSTRTDRATARFARVSRSDDVVDGVKQMILDGRLQPGRAAALRRRSSPRTLGVSRGSLREGVRALGTLGILDSRHGDGTYVTTLDPALLLAPVGFVADLQDDAAAFHSVRRLLETEAAGLAALHVDDASLAPAARSRSTRPPARSSQVAARPRAARRRRPRLPRGGRAGVRQPGPRRARRRAWPAARPGRGCGAGSATRAPRTGRSSSTRRSSRPSRRATPTGRGCGWPPTCSASRTPRPASRAPWDALATRGRVAQDDLRRDVREPRLVGGLREGELRGGDPDVDQRDPDRRQRRDDVAQGRDVVEARERDVLAARGCPPPGPRRARRGP